MSHDLVAAAQKRIAEIDDQIHDSHALCRELAKERRRLRALVANYVSRLPLERKP
jgi:hypothetical protein